MRNMGNDLDRAYMNAHERAIRVTRYEDYERFEKYKMHATVDRQLANYLTTSVIIYLTSVVDNKNEFPAMYV